MMTPPPVPPEAPSPWLTYVTVSDIEATVKAVLDAGGKVLHRMDMPDVGKMAVIEDPQGAKISAIQYAKGFQRGHRGDGGGRWTQNASPI